MLDLFKPIEKKSIMHEEETEISSGNLWKKKIFETVGYKSDKYPYVTEKIIFEWLIILNILCFSKLKKINLSEF